MGVAANGKLCRLFYTFLACKIAIKGTGVHKTTNKPYLKLENSLKNTGLPHLFLLLQVDIILVMGGVYG